MSIPALRRTRLLAAAALPLLFILPSCRERRPATVLLHVDLPELAADPGGLLTDALLLAVVNGAGLTDWPEFSGLPPRTVARRILRASDLDPAGGDRLVRLSFRLGDPDLSRRLANLLADHLAARHRELRLTPLAERARLLSVEAGAVQRSLARLDRELDALPESEPQVLALRLEEVRTRLLRSAAEAEDLELALAADRPLHDLLEGARDGDLPEAGLPEIAGSEDLAGRDEAIGSLHRELEALEEEYGPAYPRILECRQRIVALEAERDLARARAVARFRRTFREREDRCRVLLERRAADLHVFRELAAAARRLDEIAAEREELRERRSALRSEQSALEEASARARAAVTVLEYAAVPLD